MNNKNNYKLIPVTFSISGYVKVYDQPTLEEANKAVLSDLENYAPVDNVGCLSFDKMDKDGLQYVEGSLEVCYKTAEELRAHKVFMLMHALFDDKAIINTQTGKIYIPDISVEPFWFHGFNVKQLEEIEIVQALESYDDNPVSMYCLENYPAAGTCAPGRLGWIPLDLDEDADAGTIREAILDFMNSLSSEEIDSLMTEDDYIDLKRNAIKEKKESEKEEEDKLFESVLRVKDWVYTPRFCTVQIKEVFDSESELRDAGYTEPTYYRDATYTVLGKSLDMYHMEFAAGKKTK